ncbi:MAG TPA: ABC transporter permease, partial [Chloroflexota bacterium]|nr:ABC transporter permease [Chloroflexota bacterium]
PLLFAINLNQPIGLQNVDYLGNLVHGNLGTLIMAAGTPVVTEMGEYLPRTHFSVGGGLLASFALGVLLGLVMAYWRETWLDHVLSTVVLFIIRQKRFMKGITEGAVRQ